MTAAVVTTTLTVVSPGMTATVKTAGRMIPYSPNTAAFAARARALAGLRGDGPPARPAEAPALSALMSFLCHDVSIMIPAISQPTKHRNEIGASVPQVTELSGMMAAAKMAGAMSPYAPHMTALFTRHPAGAG